MVFSDHTDLGLPESTHSDPGHPFKNTHTHTHVGLIPKFKQEEMCVNSKTIGVEKGLAAGTLALSLKSRSLAPP